MGTPTRSENLTYERLLDCVLYNQSTGSFSWKESRSGRKQKCGYKAQDGYTVIMIDSIIYQAHRLAWFYMYGIMPLKRTIDHINRDRSDNSISNLRICTLSQNGHNKKLMSNNTTGSKGIRLKKGKWEASCQVNSKRKYLGRFNTREEATNAYNEYARNLVGEFLVNA